MFSPLGERCWKVHLNDRISCFAAQDRAACAAFFKESRIKFDNALELDRKFGEGAPI
jgi:hypothetical protein